MSLAEFNVSYLNGLLYKLSNEKIVVITVKFNMDLLQYNAKQ